ncbi:MAG: hypothetical protein DRN20_01380 [Thermoplasmata archaeon]|nr:MAG: hypothetical protein DRN20_01380 [Thermoplasmata archaeon]
MIIAQVCPYFYPHVGGVESYVQALSMELAKRGHEIHIITSRLRGYKRSEEIDGITVHRVPTPIVLYNTPFSLKVGAKIDEIDPHIVHAHTPPPITAYSAIVHCYRQRIPSVLTYHCDLEPPSPSFIGNYLINTYKRLFIGRMFKRASYLLLTTKSYAATSSTAWKYEFDVVPNAVDTKKFHPIEGENEVRKKYRIRGYVVLFVGRLVRHKGVDYLIKSAKYVPNAKFLIVGDGNMRPYLEDLARKEGVKDRVIFAGKVKDEMLPEYYNAADVLVLPSISRLEAFGIVLLEAMACGKPVIATDIPGVRDVVDESCGLLAEPMDEKDLADKINTILGDEGLREKMGKNARERVLRNFQWPDIATRIERIYYKVVQDFKY